MGALCQSIVTDRSDLWRVVLPNVSSARISAVVLSFALVFVESAIASCTPYLTLPVWIGSFAATSRNAVSMLALIGTWLLLMLIVIDTVSTRLAAQRRAGA
jgi:putative spermidine/putrescine transport system permease protein